MELSGKSVRRSLAARRGRIARRYFLTLLALVSLLTLTGSAIGFPSRAARDAQAAPGQGEQTFYVDWNITASGDRTTVTPSGGTRTEQRRVAIQGSAVVHKPPTGYSEVLPFLLTVTDDTDELETIGCGWTRTRTSITDPGRYMGGPDPWWTHTLFFRPLQRADGSWYIFNPFETAFSSTGMWDRNFTYRDDTVLGGCDEGSRTDTGQWAYYSDVFYGLSGPFEGDATGTIFSRDETYVVPALQPLNVPMTVNFHATIRLACGAAASTAAVGGGQGPNQQPAIPSSPAST
jgi:hypothetical protein